MSTMPSQEELYRIFDPEGKFWIQIFSQYPSQEIAQKKYWEELEKRWREGQKDHHTPHREEKVVESQPATHTGWYSISADEPVEFQKGRLERSIDIMRATTPRAKVWRMRVAYFIDIASSVWGGAEWAAVWPDPTILHYIFGPLLTVMASFAEFMFIDGWKKKQKLCYVLQQHPENIDARLGLIIAYVEIAFGFLGWLLDLYTTGLMGIRLAPGPIGWALGFVLVVLTSVFEFDYHLSELGLID